MVNDLFKRKSLIFFIFFAICICNCNDDFLGMELKIYKGTDLNRPIIYIETNDNKCSNRLDPATFYLNELPSCQFGLGYLDKIPDNFNGERSDSIKYLIASKKIQKHIFSFEKWDTRETYNIKSKLYLGGTPKNFSRKTVKTCKINKKDGYYGCSFNNFTFFNKTYSLKKEGSNENYIVYFVTEGKYINFPKKFQKNLEYGDKCIFTNDKNLIEVEGLLYCKDLSKGFWPLTLINDNMSITLEVDSIYRHSFITLYEKNKYERACHQYRIMTHDKDYISIPIMALKNFNVEFDIENMAMRFYPNFATEEEMNEQTKEGNSSFKFIAFISISGLLIILIIALLLYKKFRRKSSKIVENDIQKFSRYYEDIHSLDVINENGLN